MKVETVVLSRSLRLKKNGAVRGEKGIRERMQMISGGCRIERGEHKK